MTERMEERCRSCGGRTLVDAIDNFGHAYRGCATCRIVSLATLARNPDEEQGERNPKCRCHPRARCGRCDE